MSMYDMIWHDTLVSFKPLFSAPSPFQFCVDKIPTRAEELDFPPRLCPQLVTIPPEGDKCSPSGRLPCSPLENYKIMHSSYW